MYTVQCIVYTVQYTLYIVQCTMYIAYIVKVPIYDTIYSNIWLTLYDVHCILYTSYTNVYIVNLNWHDMKLHMYDLKKIHLKLYKYNWHYNMNSWHCSAYSHELYTCIRHIVYAIHSTQYAVLCNPPYTSNIFSGFLLECLLLLLCKHDCKWSQDKLSISVIA